MTFGSYVVHSIPITFFHNRICLSQTPTIISSTPNELITYVAGGGRGESIGGGREGNGGSSSELHLGSVVSRQIVVEESDSGKLEHVSEFFFGLFSPRFGNSKISSTCLRLSIEYPNFVCKVWLFVSFPKLNIS